MTDSTNRIAIEGTLAAAVQGVNVVSDESVGTGDNNATTLQAALDTIDNEIATKADISAIPDVSGLPTNAELNIERQARADADTALGGRIDGKADTSAIPDISGLATNAALTTERQARTSADTGLSNRINAKADASAIPDISGLATNASLTTERQARTSADTGLSNRINAKADTSALTAETQARTSADTGLGTRIDGKADGNRGLPAGGSQGQSLVKRSATDYDTAWQTITGGGNGGGGTPGLPGTNGWSPEFAVASDGERRVLRISDWQGGTGTKPPVGQYVGATALVSDIAQAVDIRGAIGGKGDKGDGGDAGSRGWSPELGIADGGTERRVLVIRDWSGGQGAKPPVGQYIGAGGTLTSFANGVDIRGSSGAPGTPGAGVPNGGSLGQILAKASSANQDTQWINAPSGNGGGGVALPDNLRRLNDQLSSSERQVAQDARQRAGASGSPIASTANQIQFRANPTDANPLGSFGFNANGIAVGSRNAFGVFLRILYQNPGVALTNFVLVEDNGLSENSVIRVVANLGNNFRLVNSNDGIYLEYTGDGSTPSTIGYTAATQWSIRRLETEEEVSGTEHVDFKAGLTDIEEYRLDSGVRGKLNRDSGAAAAATLRGNGETLTELQRRKLGWLEVNTERLDENIENSLAFHGANIPTSDSQWSGPSATFTATKANLFLAIPGTYRAPTVAWSNGSSIRLAGSAIANRSINGVNYFIYELAMTQVVAGEYTITHQGDATESLKVVDDTDDNTTAINAIKGLHYNDRIASVETKTQYQNAELVSNSPTFARTQLSQDLGFAPNANIVSDRNPDGIATTVSIIGWNAFWTWGDRSSDGDVILETPGGLPLIEVEGDNLYANTITPATQSTTRTELGDASVFPAASSANPLTVALGLDYQHPEDTAFSYTRGIPTEGDITFTVSAVINERTGNEQTITLPFGGDVTLTVNYMAAGTGLPNIASVRFFYQSGVINVEVTNNAPNNVAVDGGHLLIENHYQTSTVINVPSQPARAVRHILGTHTSAERYSVIAYLNKTSTSNLRMIAVADGHTIDLDVGDISSIRIPSNRTLDVQGRYSARLMFDAGETVTREKALTTYPFVMDQYLGLLTSSVVSERRTTFDGEVYAKVSNTSETFNVLGQVQWGKVVVEASTSQIATITRPTAEVNAQPFYTAIVVLSRQGFPNMDVPVNVPAHRIPVGSRRVFASDTHNPTTYDNKTVLVRAIRTDTAETGMTTIEFDRVGGTGRLEEVYFEWKRHLVYGYGGHPTL